jgi:hypothetical protein
MAKFALLFRARCCLLWLVSTFDALAPPPPGVWCCLQVWGWVLAACSIWHKGCCWDEVGWGYEVLYCPLPCGHLMAVLVARP